MFYLAAHYVTGKEKYKTEYEKYISEALEASQAHPPDTMRCYCSLQMQCSLRVVYDLDPIHRAKSLSIMLKNAEYGAKKAVINSKEYCKPEHKADIDYRFHKWSEVEPRNMGSFYGFNYINPAQSERKDNRAFYPVREIGEGAITAAMCPLYLVSDELLEAVDNMACTIDYRRHSSIYAPLLLICAKAACLENQKNNQ